jgi:hypothetical protein
LRATIRLEYGNVETAAAVALAVSPDNSEAPEGLTVKTQLVGDAVFSEVELHGKLATFIATIDDLLESTSTAEKALRVVGQKRLHQKQGT